MKHILIITQHFLHGGLETNILTTIKYLKKNKYKFSLITSENANLDGINPYLEGSLLIKPEQFTELTTSSVDLIRSYIREHNIDEALIHPFNSLPLGALACYLEQTPYFAFVHGPVNISTYDRENYLFNKYFTFPKAQQVYGVSNELQGLLKYDFHVNAKVLLNPIDTTIFVKKDEQEHKDFVFIGRLDEDKMYGLKKAIQFIEYYNSQSAEETNRKLKVVGKGNSTDALLTWLDENVENHQEWIEFIGFKQDVSSYINNAFFVFGMGRVALEAIVSGVPVILTGYDGLKGAMEPTMLEDVGRTNFSGRGLPNVTFEQLNSRLNNKKGFEEISQLLQKQYDIETIGQILVEDLSNPKTTLNFNLINLYSCDETEEELAELKQIFTVKELDFDFESFFEHEMKLARQAEEDPILMQQASLWAKEYKLKKLEDKVKQLEDKVKQLDEQEKDLRKQMTELEQREKELLDSITNLEQEQTNFKNYVTSLEQEKEALKNQVTNLEQHESNLKSHITELEKREIYISELEQQLDDVYNTKIWKIMSVYYKLRNK